jgi:hypothetical protein
MSTGHQLAAILRTTLKSVERSVAMSPNDPHLLELERFLLLKIAQLEKEQGSETPLK